MSTPQRSYRSTIDSIHPFVMQHWLLCFACKFEDRNDIYDTLRSGLEALKSQCPFLPGIVRREQQRGRHESRVFVEWQEKDNIDIRINEVPCDGTPDFPDYPELRDQSMPVDRLFTDRLFPRTADNQTLNRVLSVQVNFMEGGCIVAVRIHHSVFDGTGTAHVISAWAESCKLVSGLSGQIGSAGDDIASAAPRHLVWPVPDELERTQLSLPGAGHESTVSEEALTLQWQLLGLQHAPQQIPRPPKQQMRSLSYQIFSAPLEVVKALRYSGGQLLGDQVTLFDIVAAFLWRSITRARVADEKTTPNSLSRLRIPVNVRTALGLPQEYVGNAFLNGVAIESVDNLVASCDIVNVALAVSRAKSQARSKASARRAVDLARALPPPQDRKPFFPSVSGLDIVLTSWRDMGFYGDDWGTTFGARASSRPEFVRSPYGQYPGVCALLPCQSDHGLIEVMVSSTYQQLDRLMEDQEFGKVFSPLSARGSTP